MSAPLKQCPNADPVHGHVTLRPDTYCRFCGEYQPRRMWHAETDSSVVPQTEKKATNANL
jgi:hypothetical protein